MVSRRQSDGFSWQRNASVATHARGDCYAIPGTRSPSKYTHHNHNKTCHDPLNIDNKHHKHYLFMFGESDSESPRVPSPWDSLISSSPGPAPSPVHTTLPRLVPENDSGNVEYKLQLLYPSAAPCIPRQAAQMTSYRGRRPGLSRAGCRRFRHSSWPEQERDGSYAGDDGVRNWRERRGR